MNLFASLEEPALENYFYWKGRWVDDAKAVSREAWDRNYDAFKENNLKVALAFQTARGEKKPLLWLKTTFYIAQSAAVFLGTFIWTPILVVAFCIAAAVLCLSYSALAICLATFERVYAKVNGLFNLCKHCHSRVDLPVYECPNCHARHMRLLPGPRYGVFYRRCSTPGCSFRIPTLRLTGAKHLPAFCRSCGMALSNDDYVPITVAFLGGPSVGKTMLFNALATESLQSAIQEHSWTMVVNDDEAEKIKQMKDWVAHGITPRTTQDRAIEAFCVDADRGAGKFPLRVYLYDPPGESFKSTAKLSVHKYYNNLRGIIWVIDPFTLETVRSRLGEYTADLESAKIGALGPEECFERWLIGMEKDFSGVVKDSVCAVVINKTDVPCFKNTMGLQMGDGDEKCRKFLSDQDCDGFVNTVDRTFSKVRYFAVSATGGSEEGVRFTPKGLNEAARWVFENLVA